MLCDTYWGESKSMLPDFSCWKARDLPEDMVPRERVLSRIRSLVVCVPGRHRNPRLVDVTCEWNRKGLSRRGDLSVPVMVQRPAHHPTGRYLLGEGDET